MGLSKRIVLDSGVTVNYHRIVTLTIVTNVQNVIEVASYTSQAKRRESVGNPDVFISTAYMNAPYDQGMTVEAAYSWLKENTDLADANDVMEGD